MQIRSKDDTSSNPESFSKKKMKRFSTKKPKKPNNSSRMSRFNSKLNFFKTPHPNPLPASGARGEKIYRGYGDLLTPSDATFP